MSKLGLELGSFLNTGTIASPTWAEIGPIRDETLNLSRSLADVTTRQAKGFRLQRGTLMEGTIDATMIYKPGNTQFDAIQTAFFASTQIILGLFDGDVTVAGTYYGLHSAANVTDFSMNRELEEAATISVQFTLDLETTTETAPAWVTVVTA